MISCRTLLSRFWWGFQKAAGGLWTSGGRVEKKCTYRTDPLGVRGVLGMPVFQPHSMIVRKRHAHLRTYYSRDSIEFIELPSSVAAYTLDWDVPARCLSHIPYSDAIHAS